MKTAEQLTSTIQQKLTDLERADQYASRMYVEAQTEEKREEAIQYSNRNTATRMALEDVLSEDEED